MKTGHPIVAHKAHRAGTQVANRPVGEESIVALVTLLAFYLGPLATVQAAGCLTACPSKGLSQSSLVTEQHPGLLAATPANAQTAPLPLTVTPGNGTLMVSWEPPVGYDNSQAIEYDLEYSDDGGSTWWPWHLPSRLDRLTVTTLGVKNGTTHVVRVTARDSQDDDFGKCSASGCPSGA